MAKEKQFYIVVTIPQANTILDALKKVAYEDAEPIIREITNQAKDQLETPPT